MILNHELLYLHVPKTAGKSIALALVRTIERPIRCFLPPGTEKMLREQVDLDGVTIERSSGHEGVFAAAKLLRGEGRTVDDLKMILVAIRSPYDLMVSNYHFMRQNYETNQGRDNFEIAHSHDFETFAAQSRFAPIDRWFVYGDRIPANLRLIRYESLEAEFTAALGDLGYDPPPLERVNRSTHEHYLEYLTPAAEQSIYEKFAYLFDNGYYERVSPG